MTEKEREYYVVRIGPLLKTILEQQRDRIKEVTMECIAASEYEAGEVLAKKIKNNNII